MAGNIRLPLYSTSTGILPTADAVFIEICDNVLDAVFQFIAGVGVLQPLRRGRLTHENPLLPPGVAIQTGIHLNWLAKSYDYYLLKVKP